MYCVFSGLESRQPATLIKMDFYYIFQDLLRTTVSKYRPGKLYLVKINVDHFPLKVDQHLNLFFSPDLFFYSLTENKLPLVFLNVSSCACLLLDKFGTALSNNH